MFERNSDIKHEYIYGDVIAMAGASWEHNMICSSIIASLLPQLRGESCKVSPSDLRLKVTKTKLYTYPDITVICGEPKFAGNEFDTLVNPIVLIEVLSKSTEAYDRGEKFQHYRSIETLQNYLLISQDKPHIEGYTRQENGTWNLSEAIGLDAHFDIRSISCTLALADVYENVSFPQTHTE
ncbi:MAG: Uma2 family endonuclease [Anaerolineae bacterium]|nr:Uma2 family endonuclease [Anaerolineae bacterium]